MILFTLTLTLYNVYVEFLQVEDMIPSDEGYQLIPGPELRMNETTTAFELNLLETGRQFRLPKYPNFLDSPELICHDQCLYHVSLDPVQNNPTLYVQQSNVEELKLLNLGEELLNYVQVRYDNYLYVVENEKYLE